MILYMVTYLRKFKSTFLILVVTTLLFGCGKSNVKWVVYDETYCADKWDYNINNEKLKDNVVSYMKSKSIKIYELEIFSDRTAESCSACTCKSGRRFKCKVKKNDVNDAKALGFYTE